MRIGRKLFLGLSSLALFAHPNGAANAEPLNDKLPKIDLMSPTWVDLDGGKFNYSTTDLAIGPLKFIRGTGLTTFVPTSSIQSGSQYFGGWHHNFGSGLRVGTSGSDTFARVVADGQTFQYRRDAEGRWQPWAEDTQGTELAYANGKFTLRNKAGTVYSFTPHPHLTNPVMTNGTQTLARADYADGSRLDYSHNGSAQVRTIISNRGYAIVLDYNSNGAISTACGYNSSVQYVDVNSTCQSASLKASYSYTAANGANLLTTATDASRSSTDIQYNGEDLVSCIMVSGAQTCKISNVYGPQPGEDPSLTKGGQVRRQTLGTGEVWEFRYTNTTTEDVRLQPGEIRYTDSTMIDPLRNETVAVFANGLLESLTGPAGKMTYRFSGSVPKKFVFPEENAVEIVRDSRLNPIKVTLKAKPGFSEADIVSTNSYPENRYEPSNNYTMLVGCIAASQKLCDKPIYTADANNNRTDFTYSPEHGGVLTETGPAVNGVRPQKRYTYAQRYAWINNGSGGYVRAATPVWLLTQESFCKTGSPNSTNTGCALADDEVVTSYDYGPDSGPNNLLLRGTVMDAGGLNLRTCFAYDANGNKISETSPKGTVGLTSCN